MSSQITSRRDEASSHRQHMGQRKERGEMGQTSHHDKVRRKGRGLNAQPRFFQVSKSFAVTDEEGLMREAPLSPVVPHLSGGPGVSTCWTSLAHAGAAQHSTCPSQGLWVYSSLGRTAQRISLEMCPGTAGAHQGWPSHSRRSDHSPAKAWGTLTLASQHAMGKHLACTQNP